MEIRNEVKVFKIDRPCEKCKEGNMIFTGESWSMGSRKSYGHKCDKCEFSDTNEIKKYPIIEYQTIKSWKKN